MTPPGGAHDPLRDTALWRALDDALAALVAEGDVVLCTERAQVTGLLASRVAALPALPAPGGDARAHPTGEALLAFLERAAGAGGVDHDWARFVAARFDDPDLEEARRQAAFVHLRLESGAITGEQATTYLDQLARGLRVRGRPADG